MKSLLYDHALGFQGAELQGPVLYKQLHLQCSVIFFTITANFAF